MNDFLDLKYNKYYYFGINVGEKAMKKMKKPEFKLWKEFKAFINRGSVLDLAVGMIIGSAFTAIVNALVKGILQPLINMIPLGDGKSLQVVLRNPVVDEAGTVIKEAVIMDFGAIISAIITFLLTAIVLFAIIKLINSVKGGFTGLKRDTKFIESLTNEEKATIKGKIPTRKELRAIKAARDEAQAKADAEAAAAAAAAKPETTDDLLREIRDLLKAQQVEKATALLEEKENK